MKEHIGESFFGTINAVVPFGVFVALDDVFIEGLVHVSDLGADYFVHDVVRHEMRGERTGVRYRLGDRAKVTVVRADLDSGKIDFVLDDPNAKPASGRSSAGAGKPGFAPLGKSGSAAGKHAAKSGDQGGHDGKRSGGKSSAKKSDKRH
ncbi:MAG TPA: S1 RNA-binding domain-containing protein [Rhodocyclaceae bacterium]|nr:S1 RNA-binding domain-containing protein [Rhodocyclaceae bacterium]